MNFKSLRIWCNLKSYFIYLFFLVLPVYCYQPISLHPRAHMLSHVIPWTSGRQTPLSVDFSRQEYWSGLPFPSPWSHILKGRMFVHSTSVIINIYTKVKEHKRDSLVAQKVKVKVKESESQKESSKNLPVMQGTWIWFLGWEDPLEKEMATHYSILVRRIPWTEEPGRLQSMGSQESDTT